MPAKPCVVSTGPIKVMETGLRLQTEALRLGGVLGHPVYDCLYLALELGAALATADRRFIRVVTRAAALPPDRLLTPSEGPA